MPRPPDLERRRALALKAAEVLEAQGLAISTEQLARAVGVNRTTLLYHFPTQLDVVQAALGELVTAQQDFLTERLEGVSHPVDRLAARARAVLEFHRGREARLVFLTQALAVAGGARVGEVMQGAAALFESARAAMVRDLEAGVAAGTVAPCDAGAVVSLTRAVIDGLTLQRVASGVEAEPALALFESCVLAPLRREVSPRAVAARRERASDV
ncbi:MAG: TetR/AcrR family transcriptional regulator [Polyangiales bacterium]